MGNEAIAVISCDLRSCEGLVGIACVGYWASPVVGVNVWVGRVVIRPGCSKSFWVIGGDVVVVT